MTRPHPPHPATPVRMATFPDGPDSVLLSPDIPARRWRGEHIRAGMRPRLVLTGLAGAVLAVLAASSGSGFPAVLALSAGVLAVAASALAGWRSALRLLTDHRHGPGTWCRLDRVRGEFFLRSRDFVDLGAAGTVARILITGVDELHRSPARAWIEPSLCGEAHRMVWQALCCLDRTRAARSLAGELSAAPDSDVGELAAAAHQAVSVIDDALDEVARHLRACLILTRAWEAKLRHRDLAARAGHTLALLPDHDHLRRLSETAEALPRTMFAYITAARDVTGAGAFPWEKPPSTWSRHRVRSGQGLS